MEMPKRRSKAMENNNTEENSFLGNTPVEDKTKKSDGHDEEGTSMEMEISKSSSSMDITIQGGHGWLAEPEQTNTLMPSSSAGKDRALIKHPQEDELQSAKAEMGEVKEENERLKLLLSRIVRNYQSLQMHFHGLLQKDEEAKKSMDPSSSARDQSNEQDEEADELVSLSLGRSSSTDQPRKDEQMKKISHFSKNGKGDDEEGLNGAGLALELGCRFEPAADQSTEVVMKNSSSDNSCGDPKEDDPTEIWPPSKTSKTTRSGDDDVSQQTHLKKARVSVRVRCDAPTMNDGCQWRKYGQKIAKGNPCPRAYYRCTVSPSCPVRKQVQRCADDMSILITTYEGSHNHPLPMSATAMASTTSAAASMLQSHSSTSQQGHTATAPISASTNLQGLNFSTSTLSQNSRLPQHFYFPNSSISTTNSHPTITLDLTAPSPSHFGRFPAAVFSSNPRYPSTCLNFSSSPSSSLDHNNHTLQLQAPWNNNHTAAGYLNYGNRVLNQVGSALSMGKQSIFQEPNNLYQSYIQNQNPPPPPPLPPPPHQQLMLTETIASATKAITSNPKFQSALAAALTSFVGTNNGGSATTGVRENNHQHQSSTSTESASGLKLKWAESLTANPIYPPSPNGIGCASSWLNKSS
ncbi:unnamed protein product [Prunus armeniaca]|uniref:WRKY domain-containing protein n=1 Tax=Prunus armeniaca TaxID=36596 RepID=A0A6J5TKN8_PRUAR|nr:unnamed protein product [Prunus armeniaca]